MHENELNEEDKIMEDFSETGNSVNEQISKKNDIKENKKSTESVLPPIILPDPSYAFLHNISILCFSQQGESHIKNNVPCQDRSGFKLINDKIIVAAIADGVGSCALSDYGAEIAVNSSLMFLEEYFNKEMKQKGFKFDDSPRMGQILREMMLYATDCVEKRSMELQQFSYSFQSTLTVAVYDGNTLYFAHAGDDGIVAQNQKGIYAMVTSRHKGEEVSSVYPLQSKNTWQFGKVNDVVAFMMATDGVLDAFVRPAAENNRIYYPFVEAVFYDIQKNEEDVKKNCRDWYEYMASESYRKSVTDDISFVSVVNHEAIQKSVKPYFKRQEWDKQTKKYEKKRKAALYPSDSKTKSQQRISKKLSEKGKSINTEEAAKQAKIAAHKMNDGMKELASASADILLKGVYRATSYLGETMEQISKDLKKRNDQRNSAEKDKNDENND